MFDLFWLPNFIKIRHLAILRPNLPKLSGSIIWNIIFMINELDLLSVPNFTALGIFFFFMCVCVWGGRGGGGRMRRLILVLMSNVCYLAEILIYVVVTVRYLVITSVYCSLLVVVTSGYCPLLVVTACYWWLLLVTSGYCSLPLVTARSHF